MSLKHDLKNIITNEEVSGPFISLFLPLYPGNDNFKFDDTEFNSLLSHAKKEFCDQYNEKDWVKYETKIKNAKNEIIFDYAQSKTLALIISSTQSYHYYLPRKVESQAHVGDVPYILPIIAGYEFMPNFNIAKISRSSFSMYTIKNGLVEKLNLDTDAPISSEKALNIDTPDQKIRIEQRAGGSYDQFRGNDVKAEADQANMTRYFQMIDEYIIKHITLKDHLNVILMATSADAGEFKKISHNQLLDHKNVITVPSEINHETLAKVTAKITDEYVDQNSQNTIDQIDVARSKKRYVEGFENVAQAANEGRLDNVLIGRELIQNENESTDQLKANKIAITTMVYGGQVNIVDCSTINNQQISGILRGI